MSDHIHSQCSCHPAPCSCCQHCCATGPTGAQGPQGPMGLPGAVGPIGPQGPVGIMGPPGSQGPMGNTGAIGPQGAQGAQGNIGATGPQGIQGNTGLAGPQGLQGPTGPTGAQGIAGNTGSAGPQGAQGNTGPEGPQGLQGEIGPTGPQGDIGPTGPQGAQGNTGPAGPTGTVSPLLQPFVNANIGPQTIPASGFLAGYGSMANPGVTFDGVSTFTVIEAGLYFLHVTLNMAPGSIANAIFSVSVDSQITLFAPAANANTIGPLSITRVQYYTAGSEVAIKNNSTGDVEIVNGVQGAGPSTASAGHLSFFRFADGAPI